MTIILIRTIMYRLGRIKEMILNKEVMNEQYILLQIVSIEPKKILCIWIGRCL